MSPNKRKSTLVVSLLLATLFFGYAWYGLNHDLYVPGHSLFFNLPFLLHVHGTSARIIALYLFTAAVLLGLNALLGDNYDKEDHPVLNVVGQGLIYLMIILWGIGVLVHNCTPKEKPVYHRGDPIVIPSSSY